VPADNVAELAEVKGANLLDQLELEPDASAL
jgi:hypothetical protein